MKIFINKKPISLLGRLLVIITTLSVSLSCEKFVAVDRLETQILAEQAFESEAMSNAAIAGLYKSMRNLVPTAFIQNNSIYSNEIISYSNTLGNTYYTLNIQNSDSSLPWANLYSMIYGANNALEKLTVSDKLSEISKKRYIAEAKFIRAIGYFYLVNFFGDVPLALTPNLNENKLLSRSSVANVYSQIITDLKEAKQDLPLDYSHANMERVRANRWVATALLARVFLFQKSYSEAEAEANEVINSGKYSLLPSSIGIFNKNNNEAILQLANTNGENNIAASNFLYTTAPFYVCSPVLLNSFEIGDLRKTTWIRTTTYLGQPVSVPNKFTSTAINPSEYNTIIRLAEIYLIRAEARNHKSDFQGCAEDVNILRLRHGGLTAPLPSPIDQDAGTTMVLHERQVELFTEGCHRFFDLKRTGRWASTMQVEKASYYKTTSELYPIPLTDMQRNPNLKQNPGYE